MKSNQLIKLIHHTPFPQIVRGCSITGSGVFNSTNIYEQIRMVQVQSIGLDYGQNFTSTYFGTRGVHQIMLRLLEPRVPNDNSRDISRIVAKRLQKIIRSERSQARGGAGSDIVFRRTDARY